MPNIFPADRPNRELLQTAIQALIQVRRDVIGAVRRGTGLRHPTHTAPDGTTKQLLAIDLAAEDTCTKILTDRFGDNGIRVLGEETLWPDRFKELDLSKQRLEGYGENARIVQMPESRIVAVIDMIDGSDLVERNFGNWCSAMVFFKPVPSPRILFSLIHHSDGRIYGADDVGTFLLKTTATTAELETAMGSPEVRTLARQNKEVELPEETRQIAICFYAQQYKHFATVPPAFSAWLRTNSARQRIRVYNLAGNPMMARLANGESVHAVFEHFGQFPHDAAPGAYLALKAGAHVVDFDGVDIAVDAIAKKLMRPSQSAFQYVVASTRELAIQLAAVLRNEAKVLYRCPDGHSEVLNAYFLRQKCDVCGRDMVEHDRRGTTMVASIT